VFRGNAFAGIGDFDTDLMFPRPAGAMVIVPCVSMAWPALISRFMNTWLSCDGRRRIFGSGE